MTTTDYLLDTNACIAIRQWLANKLDRLMAAQPTRPAQDNQVPRC